MRYNHIYSYDNSVPSFIRVLTLSTSIRYVELHIELRFYCEVSRLVGPGANGKLDWYYDFACFAEMGDVWGSRGI